MTKNLPFQNADWFWPVIIIAIVIWLVYIWKEKSKYPSDKFFMHTFISIIGIIALVMLVLKPLTHSSEKPFQTAIITEGYKKYQLDSLKKAYPNLEIQYYNPNRNIFTGTNIPESTFMLGHGIKSYDLWQLDSVKVAYLGGPELKGITHINYDSDNKVGKQIVFQGRYLNAKKGNKLLLENPTGKSDDSITFTTEKIIDFQLTSTLKAKGQFLYHIIEKDSFNRIINKNPLPVTVSGQEPLKIVIINDFPTFETKYLKNYLSEKGHEVLVRSQLTKERYKYEYFNMKNRSSVSFNQKSLTAFDLMIIDANSLNKLSRSNRNFIEKSIRKDGLGVYIQADEEFFNSNNKIAVFAFQRDKIINVYLKNHPRTKIGTHPFRFKSEFSLQPIELSKPKTISAYKNLGIGRIGTSVSLNSYELLLNGNDKVYQKLWSKIIEKLGKKQTSIVSWDINSTMSFLNEPMDFNVRTRIEQPIVSIDKIIKIPMRRDINLSSLWKGTTYPRQVGWSRFQVEQDTSFVKSYYVQDSMHWKALKAYQNISENKRYFSTNKQIKIGTPKSTKPINSIWFFSVFLASVGYLWLEPKL